MRTDFPISALVYSPHHLPSPSGVQVVTMPSSAAPRSAAFSPFTMNTSVAAASVFNRYRIGVLPARFRDFHPSFDVSSELPEGLVVLLVEEANLHRGAASAT